MRPSCIGSRERLRYNSFKFQVSSFKVQNKVQSLKSKSLKSSKTDSQILNPKSQEEAEACFLKAIEIARHQQAKSLELRATVSLVATVAAARQDSRSSHRG